ncbi:hypothetical protein [Mesobacillus maritimus]|uniref:hypothetical protein n=1 Tax=Mesobacillus maritimus TaxID=1643336 RepID=UPI00384C541A
MEHIYVSKHFSLLIYLPNCFLILLRITIRKAMLIRISYFKVELVTVIALGFVGFITTIILSFSRDAAFYGAFIPIITIGLIIITILAIYGKIKNRVPKIIAMVFLSVSAVTLFVHEGYQTYLTSLEVVSTQDVDLTEYMPFAEDTKSVKLKGESTFKIKGDLPTLDGATALYPIYAAFVQAVYPEKE